MRSPAQGDPTARTTRPEQPDQPHEQGAEARLILQQLIGALPRAHIDRLLHLVTMLCKYGTDSTHLRP